MVLLVQVIQRMHTLVTANLGIQESIVKKTSMNVRHAHASQGLVLMALMASHVAVILDTLVTAVTSISMIASLGWYRYILSF
jgi:hypothetical protein